MQAQREEFLQFGIMADWHGERGTYCTMGPSLTVLQKHFFHFFFFFFLGVQITTTKWGNSASFNVWWKMVMSPSHFISPRAQKEKLFLQGLIYTAQRPVFYSPSSRSALAEAELEYVDNHVSTAVYVAFVLDASSDAPVHSKLKALLDEGSRVELLVWTTTPWTLSANMAIAVHPELVYALVRSTSDRESVMIVARDRLDALSEVIGPFEQLFEVNGQSYLSQKRRLFSMPVFH
jgi:hypothetical protein